MRLKLSVRCAVDRLGNALAIGIVAVGDAAAGCAHRRQLAAMLPGIGPCAVGQGIAYGVVGDGLPIERRQQVRPIGAVVGVVGGDRTLRRLGQPVVLVIGIGILLAVRAWPLLDGHARQLGQFFPWLGSSSLIAVSRHENHARQDHQEKNSNKACPYYARSCVLFLSAFTTNMDDRKREEFSAASA